MVTHCDIVGIERLMSSISTVSDSSVSHVAVSFSRTNIDHRAHNLQSITSNNCYFIQDARYVNYKKKQLMKKLEGKVRRLVVRRTQHVGYEEQAGKDPITKCSDLLQ